MHKTPDEIKKGLNDPIPVHFHIGDPEPRLTPLMMFDLEELHADALAYISQLESQNRCFKEIKESCEKRMIEMAQRMPRWISVEERLPSEHISVAVYIDEGAGHYWIQTAYLNGGKWRIPGEFVVDRNITYWMPLPEPPKEE